MLIVHVDFKDRLLIVLVTGQSCILFFDLDVGDVDCSVQDGSLRLFGLEARLLFASVLELLDLRLLTLESRFHLLRCDVVVALLASLLSPF